jgi:hypothetical protein
MRVLVNELNWDWPEIAVVLMWKLAPNGIVITRKDLGALPVDRVLIDERLVDRINFRWMRPEDAREHAKRLKRKTGEKAGISQLQGRWQKIAIVLLWKLAKDGVVLGQWDRDAVPADKTLLAHGHEQDIEYRFVPRLEAVRIANWEKENEGKIVLEAM